MSRNRNHLNFDEYKDPLLYLSKLGHIVKPIETVKQKTKNIKKKRENSSSCSQNCMKHLYW